MQENGKSAKAALLKSFLEKTTICENLGKVEVGEAEFKKPEEDARIETEQPSTKGTELKAKQLETALPTD